MDLAQDGANDPTSLPAYDALARHLMEKSGAVTILRSHSDYSKIGIIVKTDIGSSRPFSSRLLSE